MSRQTKCVNKVDRPNPWERITHIGGDGWRVSQADGIRLTKEAKRRGLPAPFYVLQYGRRVDVIVGESRFGNEYLKTEADAVSANNLLSLPECIWG